MRMPVYQCVSALMLNTCIMVTAQQNQIYWWLGLPSPFGGKNYNLEQIQRGEHISNSSRFSRVVGSQRKFRKINKRQAEDEGESLIELNEIETECPRLSTCVPRFFCERFRGRTVFDQIPCLLTSGDFEGEFGICCQDEFPRKCPEVRRPPPAEQCRPRPLGRPEDHECSSPGSKGVCVGENSLCCFNGCLNVCLTDPPYSVQKAFFIREKAFVVETNPDSSGTNANTSGPETFENNFEEANENDDEYEDDYDDDFFSGALQPRTVTTIPPRRAPRKLESRTSDQRNSSHIAHLLRRLLSRLRDRIS